MRRLPRSAQLLAPSAIQLPSRHEEPEGVTGCRSLVRWNRNGSAGGAASSPAWDLPEFARFRDLAAPKPRMEDTGPRQWMRDGGRPKLRGLRSRVVRPRQACRGGCRERTSSLAVPTVLAGSAAVAEPRSRSRPPPVPAGRRRRSGSGLRASSAVRELATRPGEVASSQLEKRNGRARREPGGTIAAQPGLADHKLR